MLMNNNNCTQHDSESHHDTSGSSKWSSSTHQDSIQVTSNQEKKRPKLLSIHPNQGQEGTTVTLTLSDLPFAYTYKLAFNSMVVETRQIQSSLQNGSDCASIVLISTVPSFQMTLSTTNNVPISVCFLDKNDMVEDTFFVTDFTYQLDYEKTPNSQQQSQVGEKRRGSSFAEDDLTSSPTKRVCDQDMQYRPDSCDPPVNFSSYNNTHYSSYQHDDRNQFQRQRQQHNNPLPIIMESSPNEIQQYYFPQQSPYGLPSTALPPTSSSSSSDTGSRLQSAPQRRKSSSQHSTKPILKAISHSPLTNVANYHPYPGQVDHSNFELVDDLDAMMQHWTMVEQHQGRRLVRFWCKEDNTQDKKIISGCHPVTQTDPVATDATHTVVSCIYWPEQDDYFITSVDCIFLLESLLRTHFGVEEKNRIRRNLEGFRPITVAKAKPATAELFKRVMGFPHPKPRNIEKDIKAFRWKILPYAIKKIVAKHAMESAARHTEHSDPSSSYNMLPLSLHSRTTSLGSEATIYSSTSTSSMPTPPPVSEDDSYLQYQHYQTPHNKHNQVYYNPTTMTYGDHQEPGVRFAKVASPSSSSVTNSPPSPNHAYHQFEPTTCNNSTYLPSTYQPSFSSTTSSYQPLMIMNSPLHTSESPFVSQLLMENGSYNLV
ncbi:hypothetical protein BC941DRAFT_417588 [Chlamydoabsidia padenii]|nr:hypothetical protein BC941DRAFT_417588 [Chlamydoabsidia padenii]